MNPNLTTPHAVYRIFGGDILLYVGCSGNVLARIYHHSSAQAWVHQITDITVAWYPTARLALDAETAAIATEHPVYPTPEDKRGRRYPMHPCRECGVLVSASRELCAPCRQKADRTAQDAWKARHPEKQAEYNARYGPRRSTETKAERKARYERSKMPSKKSREALQGS